jgi:hypothetical protein
MWQSKNLAPGSTAAFADCHPQQHVDNDVAMGHNAYTNWKSGPERAFRPLLQPVTAGDYVESDPDPRQ